MRCCCCFVLDVFIDCVVFIERLKLPSLTILTEVRDAGNCIIQGQFRINRSQRSSDRFSAISRQRSARTGCCLLSESQITQITRITRILRGFSLAQKGVSRLEALPQTAIALLGGSKGKKMTGAGTQGCQFT